MSKPTKEEMSFWFYELCQHDPGELTEKSQLMRQSICALIASSDRGLEVDEEFIRRWMIKFSNPTNKGLGWQICQLLREAGVRVKEKP